ncbi:hypothetical protein GEMRC1_014050 [Eukaryota sp. GEM-RC1]
MSELTAPPIISAANSLLTGFEPHASSVDVSSSATIDLILLLDRYSTLYDHVSQLESVLSSLKSQQIIPSVAFQDPCTSVIDQLSQLVSHIDLLLDNRSSISLWLQKAKRSDLIDLPIALRKKIITIITSTSSFLSHHQTISALLSKSNYHLEFTALFKNFVSVTDQILLMVSSLDDLSKVLQEFCPL